MAACRIEIVQQERDLFILTDGIAFINIDSVMQIEKSPVKTLRRELQL